VRCVARNHVLWPAGRKRLATEHVRLVVGLVFAGLSNLGALGAVREQALGWTTMRSRQGGSSIPRTARLAGLHAVALSRSKPSR
jgi:hypothetical protein